MGRAEDYERGSVTSVERGDFYLVRLEDGTFIALSWVDSHSDCTIPWRQAFVLQDPQTRRTQVGWFRDPCHGSTYRMNGERVLGPAPRDMDQYPVQLVGNRVEVTTAAHLCGFAPPDADCVTP